MEIFQMKPIIAPTATSLIGFSEPLSEKSGEAMVSDQA